MSNAPPEAPPDTPFELCLITADATLAGLAARAGVERVFVDLERLGKAERQKGQNLFQSDASLADLAAVRAAFHRPGLLVRVNPLNPGTAGELDAVLAAGADIVMLPMARAAAEVAAFIALVRGRARVCLLLETRDALASVEAIARLPGLDEVHVGLNDLRLSLDSDHLFAAIFDGHIERVAQACATAGIRFGFGGVTRPSDAALPVPPDCLIAETVRHGARMALLGRSFKSALSSNRDHATFANGIEEIRARARHWSAQPAGAFDASRARLAEAVARWTRAGLGD